MSNKEIYKLNPNPIPKPEPEPKPEPKPEAKPKPEPEPEPVNPYERWEALSAAASMGSSDWEIEDDERAHSHDQSRIKHQKRRGEGRFRRVSVSPRPRVPLNQQPTGFEPTPSSEPTNWSNVSADAQSVILNGLGAPPSSLNEPKTQPVALASIAKAKLTTPLVWTDDSLPEETRGTVTLIEPLRADDGNIALPVNSSLIVEVASGAENGLISLEAIAIVYQDNSGEFRQQQIPPKTLLIRDENNTPLEVEAQKLDDNSPSINVLNSALKAGSSALPREARTFLKDTLNRSSRRYDSQDSIYQINAETLVSVYVNSLLTLNHD